MADILRKRLPGMPGFVAGMLARIVRQQELNKLLAGAFPYAGYEFSRRILELLDIKITLDGEANIPSAGKLVFASNHPLGGLDGITLISVLGQRYGDDGIVFPVNDMLMHVRPLQDVFTPINKYGRQGRSRTSGVADAFEGDKQVIIFPAGLVSRKGPDGIRDLEWRKTFLTRAAASGRTIVPIRFEALNRGRFYTLAQWRKRLRIPFNIEQILLPSELVNCRSKSFKIAFLPPVNPSEILARYSNARQAAQALRNLIYN